MNDRYQQALTLSVIEFLDLSLNEVWVAQLATGGNAGWLRFCAYLRFECTLCQQDRDAISHAVNELVADLGCTLRAPYSMDKETGPDGCTQTGELNAAP
ncbi:hypothetical protein J2790_001810 [Paenarthrobacter nicotinovorans]|uniref:hypothetical protein n=1 Tax=Micrococcaceae TaxID=1268 RepID=UPI000876E237|nr:MULTISPECIES: hypothetical protein [Micrococcaceae]MDR6436689.1 hypothetical protein [Paenarthrobacter nicotinovorans]SCZ56901.1 hypothetical protein SAMN02799638_02003 [Arthrobacter sp. UNCCL28]